jgi:hypothetical protein
MSAGRDSTDRREQKGVLAGGGVEPEEDAELDFHEDLPSLDDRRRLRPTQGFRQPLDATDCFPV